MAEPEASSVLFMGSSKRKVSITPRLMLTSDVKRAGQDDSKTLYHLRKLYSLKVTQNEGFSLSKTDQKGKQRLSAIPSTRRSVKGTTKDALDPSPYLGIGWELHHSSSESVLQPATVSHKPAAKSVAEVKERTAIPVKSFVLHAGEYLRREELPRTWTGSDFYRNAVAALRGEKQDREVDKPRNTTESLPVISPVFDEKPDLRGYSYISKKAVNQRPSIISPPQLAPKVLIPKLMPQAGIGKTSKVSTSFKPQPMNPRLAASKSKREPRQSITTSYSFPQVPDSDRLTVQPPVSARSHSHGLARYLVQLRPRDLPPHRIPVDYGFFRKVKRIRS